MKQAAVKGDIYLVWEDTYKDPAKKTPPPPDPLDPSDPEKYTEAPYYDPLYDVTETDAPDTGDEFVFCEGKPVVVINYVFSLLKKDTYRREWKIDDEGHLVTDKEEEYQKAKKKEEEKKEKDPSYEPKPIKKTGTPVYNDQKKDSISVDIEANDGVPYVFADGIPIACIEGGVVGPGKSYAMIDGELVITGEASVEGEFTQCFGNIYFDSV